MRKRLRYFKYNPFPKEMQAFLKKLFDFIFIIQNNIYYILFSNLDNFLKKIAQSFPSACFLKISSQIFTFFFYYSDIFRFFLILNFLKIFQKSACNRFPFVLY